MQPAERIIAQLRCSCTRHRDKPVLDVIAIAGAGTAGAFRAQVAIAVIGQRNAAGAGQLVKPVAGVGATDVVMPSPGIGAVRRRALSNLAGGPLGSERIECTITVILIHTRAVFAASESMRDSHG